MATTDDSPHCVRHAAYELNFWCGNSASNREGADRVVVQQNVSGIGRHDIAEFKLPEQKYHLERLEWALLRAHASGERDKAREIRGVLGL
jgi:hypothetical protein